MRLKNYSYLLVLSLLFSACTGTKKMIEHKSVVQPVNVQPRETVLSQDQENEMEFLFVEGLKQKALGNTKNAVSIFSRCLDIDPNSAVAMYEMARIHSENNDLTSAALLLQKACSLEPGNKWYRLMLIQIYQKRNQYDQAAAVYDQLLKGDPDNVHYLYAQALLYKAGKQYQRAIDTFNRLEKQTGFNEQIAISREQIYEDWGKKELALQELNHLIQKDPDNPRYYGLKAEYYQDQGDHQQALNNYNKILQLDPDNGFVHFSLAGFYQLQGNYDKAFDEIKKAFNNDQIDADTKIRYYMLQTADSNRTSWTDSQISKLIDILHFKYPEDNRMYTIYAEHMIRQNKLNEARSYLRKYLKTDPKNFDIWQQMLFLSNDLMDFKTLYEDTQTAMRLFPDKAVVYALNAVSALQLKKYKEALDVIDRGEPYAGNNQQLKIQMEIYKAEGNYQLGHVKEAFKAYDQVIALDPNNYMAMNNYAYYLSLENVNLERAEKLSDRVVQANPNNPTYLDTHAWVLFKLKKYSRAKLEMETALKNGGDSIALLVEHYGDILYMLGQKDKALEEWKKAQKIGGGSDVLGQQIKEKHFIQTNK